MTFARRQDQLGVFGVAPISAVDVCFSKDDEVRILFTHFQNWNLPEAEARLREILVKAKTGQVQRIADEDGVFEITFVSKKESVPVGEVLSRGGPNSE